MEAVARGWYFDGLSGQHLHVLMTQLLQETLGSGRRTGGRTCGMAVKRDPRCTLASMDIKTAFDVARSKHVAKILGDQEVHARITAAFLADISRPGRPFDFRTC